MPIRIEITSYSVIYSANTFNPRIGLLNANRFIGQLVFFPNGATLPLDLQAQNGQLTLNYHQDDFHNLIDVLRNEKPIFLSFNGSGPGFENSIQTGAELVGEGE